LNGLLARPLLPIAAAILLADPTIRLKSFHLPIGARISI
jgi:hypothetical protein